VNEKTSLMGVKMVEEQWSLRNTDDELLHRIRKLKWIGMERDAEALERALREMRPHESVLSLPADTD
jgi:hypothetical protein